MPRLLLVIALAAAGPASAGGDPPLDHLIPAQNGASVTASPLLPRRESGAMTAIYCDVPLGRPWAVAIRKADSGKAVLEFRQARQLGGADNPSEMVSSQIPMDLAVAASAAIHKMVQEARSPEREPIAKREAAAFHFIDYTDSGTPRSAWTLAPDPSSRPGRLVDLAGILFALSRHPDAARAEAAKQLADELSYGHQK
jgi:hypothetical protein